MEFHHFDLPGPVEIVPRRIGDERGYFSEVFRLDPFVDQVGPEAFVQENESLSARAGTVRGLHFQSPPHAQAKLVRCGRGVLFDVAVDIRRGSPTFGAWEGVLLSAENKRQFWIPEGFAHGFLVLSDTALFSYLCTEVYVKEADAGIRWDDSAVGIDWPVDIAPLLSEKDANAPLLADVATERLPVFAA